MQDLTSSLKPDPVSAVVPTSQHAGETSANNAMTAPGGASSEVTVEPAPVVDARPKTQPGDDGKPQPTEFSTPGAPAWTNPPAHSN